MSVLISRIVAIFFGLEICILIHHKDTKIALIGSWVSVRVPDLMILTEEVVTALGRARHYHLGYVLTFGGSSVNEDRDDRHKRSRYADWGILKCWSRVQKVTILS
jgi:hypothetical protein